MVADVEDLIPRDAQVTLYQCGVAPEPDASGADACGRWSQITFLAHHLEHGGALPEERRLARRDDLEVEQIAPCGAVFEELVEGVLHHRLRVLPLRVRDEHELLPGAALVEQGEGQLRVELHEAVRVGDDLRLELSLHVRLVDRRAHEAVEIGVSQHALEPSRIEQVYELRVHARF